MLLPSLRVRPEAGGTPPRTELSIAVSAIVCPSRIGQLIYLSMSTLLLATAVLLLGVAASEKLFIVRAGSSGVAFCCAVMVFIHAKNSRLPVCLDISGQGQIRLVSQAAATSSATEIFRDDSLFYLQPYTLIFPSLLLLRLKAETGPVISLPIFTDSVSSTAFRRLSVACRWIASQNHRDSK